MKGHDVRAARYYGQHDIRVEQVPEPQVREPDDVLVEVAYCGIVSGTYPLASLALMSAQIAEHALNTTAAIEELLR